MWEPLNLFIEVAPIPFPGRVLRQLAALLAIAVALALFVVPAASAQTWDPDDGDPYQQLQRSKHTLGDLHAALARARTNGDGPGITRLQDRIAAEEAYERTLQERLGLRQPEPPPTTAAPKPESSDAWLFDDAQYLLAKIELEFSKVLEQAGAPGAKERREAAEERLREVTGRAEPKEYQPPPADAPAGEGAEQGSGDGQQQPQEAGEGAGEGGTPTPAQSLEAVIIGDGLGEDDGGGSGEPAKPVVIGGTAPKVGTPAQRPDDQEPADDDTASKLTVHDPGLMGGGPNGNGPCRLPAELKVFCPIGQDEQPPVVTDPAKGLGDILVHVPGKEPIGPGVTTPPELVQPGTTDRPCPAVEAILTMCAPGQGGGSGIRLQTGTVTLAPDTKGDLRDLFETNSDPNASVVLPVVPAAPGLLLPAAVTTRADTHQPSLFATIDPVITVAGTSGDTTSAGAVGALAEVAGTGAEQAARPRGAPAADPVGGLVTGAGSGLATGAGGTVTPTTSAPAAEPAEPGGAPLGGGTGEPPPVCDPGVPC